MRYYSADDFTPETSLGYLVRRAYQLSHGAIEPAHAASGLTGTQWSALVLLMSGRCTTCAELARDLAYDKGAITRLADQLEAAGYLERRRSDGDRRVVQLLITPAGTAIAERQRQHVLGRWNEWLADWSRDDVDTLVALLRRLDGRLETVAGQ